MVRNAVWPGRRIRMERKYEWASNEWEACANMRCGLWIVVHCAWTLTQLKLLGSPAALMEILSSTISFERLWLLLYYLSKTFMGLWTKAVVVLRGRRPKSKLSVMEDPMSLPRYRKFILADHKSPKNIHTKLAVPRSDYFIARLMASNPFDQCHLTFSCRLLIAKRKTAQFRCRTCD